jgi:tetratricopeptide (TPR) repeat protein
MNLKYEDILNFPDLNAFEPEQVVGILGLIFETSRELKNVETLKTGLDFSKKQNLTKFSDSDKMIFYFNVANGWSYLQKLTQALNSFQFWEFENPELEQQIINLRSALKNSQTVNDDFNNCQILTNLGNLFSHLGRFSEAQTYWQNALKIIPDFPMAIGNIGFGLTHYAKILYDEGHQLIFFQFAYKYLKQSIALDIYDEAKETFNNQLLDIEDHIDKNLLLLEPVMKEFSLGKSNVEKLYRKWCLNSRLFLNPLNDISIYPIAAHDCLYLPGMILNLSQPPIYHSIFNQIKQEYVSARFLLYEGIYNKKLHFSDKGNLQMDTLDYATYSLSIEKVKIAFRTCYSIFDKIGFLINDYLSLGVVPDKVTFRNIWYSYKNNKPKALNKKISIIQNWAFRGLYWLSKDLYEKNFASIIEPEAQEIAMIRNFIEHKSFKTVEFGISELTDGNLTYSISRNEFESKTIKLFTLTRAAIIYLSLGINLEEKKKVKDNPILFPIDFQRLRDDYKR